MADIRVSRAFHLIFAGGVFCLVAGLLFFIDRSPYFRQSTALPTGEVEPYLKDGLLLAPDGTVWKVQVDSTGAETSLKFAPHLPGDDWMRVHGTIDLGIAIRQDGSLWAWGFNFDQDGRFYRIAPHPVGADSDWHDGRICGSTAALLKRDGSLWLHADLHEVSVHADGTTEIEKQPARISHDYTWKDIAFDENCTLYAIRSDDRLWCLGMMGFNSMPQLLGPTAEWKKLFGDYLDIIAQDKHGALWSPASGASSTGPVESGAPSLERISDDLDWLKIATGTLSVAAQKKDGSWWMRGVNRYSSLGSPHRSGNFGSLIDFTRMKRRLDAWAWDLQHGTTIVLLRDGSFHYIGKRPEAPPRTGLIPSAKEMANEVILSFTSKPRPFPDPAEDYSSTPVKIGELPESVLGALKSAAPN